MISMDECVIDLESGLMDGRLTESSNREKFRWKDMIEEVERLRRPLTEDEIEKYRESVWVIILVVKSPDCVL